MGWWDCVVIRASSAAMRVGLGSGMDLWRVRDTSCSQLLDQRGLRSPHLQLLLTPAHHHPGYPPATFYLSHTMK